MNEKMDRYHLAAKAAGAHFTPLIISQLGKVYPPSLRKMRDWLGLVEEKDDEDTRMTLVNLEDTRRKLIYNNLLTTISCICNLYAAQSLLDHIPREQQK